MVMDRPRACDRCWAIKEKCDFEEGIKICLRCLRLNHRCATVRKTGKPGRKPKECLLFQADSFVNAPIRDRSSLSSPTASSVKITTPKLETLILTTIDPLLSSLSPYEKSLLNLLLDKEFFIRHFVFGPSFASGMQSMLYNRLTTWPANLREGFLACSASFVRARNIVSDSNEVELSMSAAALQKFRTISIHDSTEAAMVLSLGTAIATFELLTSGKDCRAIYGHMLSLIRPWYSDISSCPDMDIDVLCPVLMDTAECLVRREVPVIRFFVRDAAIVDRYVGLCSTMLPILYDICVLGHETKNLMHSRSGDIDDDLAEAIAEMEETTQRWQPTPPPGFAERFSSQEVVSLLTQARAYQGVALLILHRLRHKFGTEDMQGRLKSQRILSELELCYSITGQYGVHVALPFMVAALEVTDLQERQKLIGRLLTGRGNIYYQFAQKIKGFLEYVWLRRDEGEIFSWFGLVDEVPDFAMMP